MVGSVFQIQWIHFRIHVRRWIRTQTQVFDKKRENSAEKNKYDTGLKDIQAPALQGALKT